jgi:hypothetical protein
VLDNFIAQQPAARSSARSTTSAGVIAFGREQA